jgi:hypothetical protein
MFQFALAMMTAAHYFSSVKFVKQGNRSRTGEVYEIQTNFLPKTKIAVVVLKCYLSFVNF